MQFSDAYITMSLVVELIVGLALLGISYHERVRVNFSMWLFVMGLFSTLCPLAAIIAIHR